MTKVNKTIKITDAVALGDSVETQLWVGWAGKIMGISNPLKVLATSKENIKKINKVE